MDLQTVQAVAFDLDGTLTESKSQMLPEMAALLTRLLKRMPVAVISGGAWKQFESQMLSAFPQSTDFSQLYLFTTSASTCLVHSGAGWDKRYDYVLSAEEKSRILAALDDALLQTGLNTPSHHVWGERIEDRGSQITFSGLGQYAPPDVKKTWDPDRRIRGPILDLLVQKLPEFAVRVNAYTSIDITHKNISKAYGVRQFSAFTGVPISAMLYVGDGLFEGGNDHIVIETGIPTAAVTGPTETGALISKLLA